MDRKQRAADYLAALADRGIDVDGCKTMIDMSAALRAHGFKMTRSEQYSRHVARFLASGKLPCAGSAETTDATPAPCGEVVPPRTQPAFRPYRPGLSQHSNWQRAQAAYALGGRALGRNG